MADELLRAASGICRRSWRGSGPTRQCRAYLALGPLARWVSLRRPAGMRRAYSHHVRLIEECAACGKQHSLLAGHDLRADQDRPGALVSGDLAGDLEQGRHLGRWSCSGRWVSAATRPPGAGCTRSAEAMVRPDRAAAGGAGRGRRDHVGRRPARQARPRCRRQDAWSPGGREPAAARAVAAGSAGCGCRPWPTPRPTSLAGFLARERRQPAARHHRRLGRLRRPRPGPATTHEPDQSQHILGRRRLAPARPSTSSSASPSAGCSAPITVPSARSTCQAYLDEYVFRLYGASGVKL